MAKEIFYFSFSERESEREFFYMLQGIELLALEA